MSLIIEQLIADFHDHTLPSLTNRHARIPLLPGKIDTVIGMRRTGKTWFVYQTIAEILANGTPKEAILYLNFEDDRLCPLTHSELHKIPDTFFRRYPDLRERPCFFFFDEIQTVAGWDRFVRRLLDTENVHICLTGSSAKLLSKEIATNLRGRSIATEIFPFNFKEALDHAGIAYENKRRPGTKKRALLENRLQAYLQEGGFPEVQGLETQYRTQILQEYLDVVILRDLVERHHVTNIIPLRYLIRHLLSNPASLFSINKFYNDLKSQGISCGKNSLHEYLDHLSDAYLFFPVHLHTKSERARMVNPRKIYAIDPGLVQACSRSLNPDWGHLLENFIFLELRRRHYHIEYYKTKSGKEVDFLAISPSGKKVMIQATAEMENDSTRQREFGALVEAMEECGLREATIITLNEEDIITTPAGSVTIMPAWYWALCLEE